jgi:probable rRNA maturation factor
MEALRKFLARAQSELGLAADSVTVCLVTDDEIAGWNGAYLGKPRPTDVLSFPADAERRRRKHRRANARSAAASLALRSDRVGAKPYLGDIAIAPAVARRNARRLKRKFDTEMRILILHGLLHLMGYDHETDSGQMDRRERGLRRKLGLV